MQGYPPGGNPYGPPQGSPPGFTPPGGGYGPPGYGPPPGGPPPGGPPPGGVSGFGTPPAVAPYGVHPQLGIPYSERSKVAAGLLQLFLGSFGVGRFYTGHTGLAIAQLVACQFGFWVLSWLTCGLTFFVGLWPFIDGIILLATDSKDANGHLLR